MFYLEKLPYSELLIKIARDFPPNLVLFAKYCFSENISDVIQIKLGTYYRSFSWRNGVQRLQNYGLVKIKKHSVNIHEIRPEEVSLSHKGRRIMKALKNTEFSHFLLKLSNIYFKNSEDFIEYFDSHVEYPSIPKMQKANIKEVNETIEFKSNTVKDSKLTFFYEINETSKENNKLVKVSLSLTCKYCKEFLLFQFTSRTYNSYLNKGSDIFRGCNHCKPLNNLRRTKFKINFAKRTIQTQRYLTEKDLLKIDENPERCHIKLKETEKSKLEHIRQERINKIRKNKKLLKQGSKEEKQTHVQAPVSKFLKKPMDSKKKDEPVKIKAKSENNRESALDKKIDINLEIDALFKKITKQGIDYMVSIANRYGTFLLDKTRIKEKALENLENELCENQKYSKTISQNLITLYKLSFKDFKDLISSREEKLRLYYLKKQSNYELGVDRVV